jgi:hypothetical protein
MKKIKELITSLQSYAESFPEEAVACQGTINWIHKHREFAFVKPNLDGHLTASMFIVNPERTRVLLMLHKKFQRWQQFG